jgi:speckle-type POZ protein
VYSYADLLAAADRFGTERLKVMCANKLCERVDADTVKTTLALTERHRCDGLKEACLDFLTHPANLRAAIGTRGL